MPLNASPPTVDVRGVRRQAGCARAQLAASTSALWGGSCPGNLDRARPARRARRDRLQGVHVEHRDGDFAPQRRPDAVRGDARDRRAAVAAAGRRPRRERDDHARAGRASPRPRGASRVRDYLESRPPSPRPRRSPARSSWPPRPAARCTSSTSRPPAASRSCRAPARAGIDVTCEVTAHHLLLTDEDAEPLGAIAKCAPPLRPAAEPEALWGCSPTATSRSSSPTTRRRRRELREGDAFASWGGIAGCSRRSS